MQAGTKNANHVAIFDTTLRDGEQAPGASMTVNEKVSLAHQLARLEIDIIEAGFPVSSPAQFEAVSRIASEVKGPVVCGLARTVAGDIDAAGNALVDAPRNRIHTFVATSDIHLKAKFAGKRYGSTLPEKRKTIIKMAVDAVQQARQYTDDVEFSAEDAGRTDIGFLCEVFEAVVEAGATTINIPDTTGYTVPHEYGGTFRSVRERCGFGDEIVLSAHCHDDLGLAVANSLAAVLAGARQVECTINGIGERAGNASLEEIVMALAVRYDHFGLTTSIKPAELTETSKMVTLFSGIEISPCKAIVGANAFSHEAGIHQDGVLKSRETYEIMSAADVGNEGRTIRLGRHSGRHGLFQRLETLGLDVPKSERERVYQAFVGLADKKKEVFDDDLVQLVNKDAVAPPRPEYRLDAVRVVIDSSGVPRAHVTVFSERRAANVNAEAGGDGPIDALFKALDRAIGENHVLVSYNVQSVTEGADAIGEVTVVIRESGKSYVGKSNDTDVVLGSAQAYVHAINKLAIERGASESVEFVGNGIMKSFDGESQPERLATWG